MSSHPPIAVTQECSFCAPDGDFMLAVKAGMPVSDALEQASTLLGHITRLAMDDNEQNRTTAQYLLENTKALLDASLAGIWEKEKLASEVR